MSNTKTTAAVTLRHPKKVDGETYTALTMRRALAGDSADAQREGGTAADIEMRLFANLCEVTPAVIRQLDLGDYQRLQEQFQDFLAH